MFYAPRTTPRPRPSLAAVALLAGLLASASGCQLIARFDEARLDAGGDAAAPRLDAGAAETSSEAGARDANVTEAAAEGGASDGAAPTDATTDATADATADVTAEASADASTEASADAAVDAAADATQASDASPLDAARD